MAMGYRLREPWLLAGLGLQWAVVLAAITAGARQRPRHERLCLAGVGLATILILGGIVLIFRHPRQWLLDNAMVPWLAATVLLLTSMVKASPPIFWLLPSVCLGLAMAMGYWWLHDLWLLTGLGLLWAAVLAAISARARQQPQYEHRCLAGVGLASILILGGMILIYRRVTLWRPDNTFVAWLVATALLLTSMRTPDTASGRWCRKGFLFWAIMGTIFGVSTAYVQNGRVVFFTGLAVCLALLVFWKRWFRPPVLVVQAINTVILLIVGVPLASLLWSPSDQFDQRPNLADEPYRYENARKDPAAFTRYWRASNEMGRNLRRIFLFEPSGLAHLRPNTETTLFESRIRVNSKGFRGREIPEEKGDAYRIVALGESTTFGLTLRREDRPWPEVLEQLIQERLKPRRPVQVINAGVPGVNLANNLNRLPVDILPLKPDLILSYHGRNGFYTLYQGLPPTNGRPPPLYNQRPLTLLADFEYQMKIRCYRSQYSARSEPRPTYVFSPMESQYARGYEQLIEAARTNGIRLALATYSMAIHEQSPRDVVEFYRIGETEAEWMVKANQAHNGIVRQLVRENPELGLVDTCPALDGQWGYYIDMVHFTQEGRNLLAETFFNCIRKTLEEELARQEGGAD
jgi:lysophospholipase L1-like esterase